MLQLTDSDKLGRPPNSEILWDSFIAVICFYPRRLAHNKDLNTIYAISTDPQTLASR